MISFEEQQRLSPAIIQSTYVILFVVLAVIYLNLAPTGDEIVALVAMAPAFAIVTFLFTSLKMTTTVTGEGVQIKTLYVVSRQIAFDEIENAAAVQYRPLLDYGGWGLRISGKGKAYNLSGNRGVQLALTNNRRVLIGSQREIELAASIEAGLR